VARARKAEATSDLVLLVVDASEPDSPKPQIGHSTESRQIVVSNKVDLPQVGARRVEGIAVSARTGGGLAALKAEIARAFGDGLEPRDVPAITNLRHLELVARADRALERAERAVASVPAAPEELVLADLQEARGAFEEISGRRAPDDLLAHIFSRFCVGK